VTYFHVFQVDLNLAKKRNDFCPILNMFGLELDILLSSLNLIICNLYNPDMPCILSWFCIIIFLIQRHILNSMILFFADSFLKVFIYILI